MKSASTNLFKQKHVVTVPPLANCVNILLMCDTFRYFEKK